MHSAERMVQRVRKRKQSADSKAQRVGKRREIAVQRAGRRGRGKKRKCRAQRAWGGRNANRSGQRPAEV